jgi:hypothetical protein
MHAIFTFVFVFFCYGSQLKGMTANNRFPEGFWGRIETLEAAFTASFKQLNPLLLNFKKCCILNITFQSGEI